MTLPPLFQQNLFNSKYKEEPTMSSNVRPATMERITTPALAESFIDQQLTELRQQIGDKKVLLALSGAVFPILRKYGKAGSFLRFLRHFRKSVQKIIPESVDIRSLNQYIIKKSLDLSGRTRF